MAAEQPLPPRPGPMPRTRGECEHGPRPCPWSECRHHLGPPNGWIDVVGQRITMTKRRSAETCVLDLADRGGMLPSEIGDELGCSRQRINQILVDITIRLVRDCADELEAMREDIDELDGLDRRTPWEGLASE